MRAIAVIALASGCFYTAPINQRPSVAIAGQPSEVLHRGDTVTLQAEAYDPDGDDLALQWRAYACTTAAACDADAFYPGTDQTAQITVPYVRADGTTPVQAVVVTLDAVDSYGAHARPSQQLVLGIADLPPDIAMSASSRYSNVVGTPIQVFAKVGDPDDGPSNVNVAWMVFSPASQPSFTFTDLSVAPDPNDPDHLTYGKTLVPMGVGAWTVQATATDPLGMAVTATQPVMVGSDQPPCLTQWTPIAPPVGDELPLTQATLFQVLVVTDDLDPYPPVPGDPVLGETTFAWSLEPPGGSSFQPLAATSNSVALDPTAYTPGDTLELRVEIYDRTNTPITCAPTDPTCSVTGDQSCIQRLTWDVEIQ